MGLYKQALQCKTAAADTYNAGGELGSAIDALGRPYNRDKIADAAKNVLGALSDAKRDNRKQESKELALSALAGGGAAAGAYGLTGLVPGLRDSRLLRWLLAGTAGAAAGLGTYGALGGRGDE